MTKSSKKSTNPCQKSAGNPVNCKDTKSSFYRTTTSPKEYKTSPKKKTTNNLIKRIICRKNKKYNIFQKRSSLKRKKHQSQQNGQNIHPMLMLSSTKALLKKLTMINWILSKIKKMNLAMRMTKVQKNHPPPKTMTICSLIRDLEL